jgi:hypothetical protein
MIFAVMLILLVFMPVGTVFADPPVTYSGPWEDDYISDNFHCPGIDVWDHEALTWRETDFYDKQGNVVKVQIFYIGTDTFYNPLNPGVELSGHFTATAEIDLLTGETINARGVPLKITIPGHGTALVRAGFWSHYPFVHDAGKDSFQDPGDMAAFCSYLTGQ